MSQIDILDSWLNLFGIPISRATFIFTKYVQVINFENSSNNRGTLFIESDNEHDF